MDLNNILTKIVGNEPSKKMVVVVISALVYLFTDRLGIDPAKVQWVIYNLVLPWLGIQGIVDGVKVIKTQSVIEPVKNV